MQNLKFISLGLLLTMGLATTVTTGEATITATADEKTATYTVADPHISLDKTKLELIPGEEQTLKATTTPSGQSVTWTSSDANKATVEGKYEYAKVIAKVPGTVSINATFDGQTISCTITIYDVFSQPGVTINGITWSTRNVDAPGTFAAKASDSGMFFQWNRKIGWSTTDPLTSSPSGHSWDNSNPTGTAWEATNDPSPEGWRVPTYEEMGKLLKALSGTAVVNGKYGLKFGSGNNTIFLPGCSFRFENAKLYVSERWASNYQRLPGIPYGSYWTAAEYGSGGAYKLSYIDSSNSGNRYDNVNIGYDRRDRALNIRCVKK